MLTQTGYNKVEIKFGCEILLSSDDILNDNSSSYHRFILVSISESLNLNINILNSLDENNSIYSQIQSNYIKRYKKFDKFIRENKGKQFICILPSYVANNQYFKNTGTVNILNNDICFDRTFVNNGSNVSFFTDYELIPIEPNNSMIKIKKILESIIISKTSRPLFEYDYRGRSVT